MSWDSQTAKKIREAKVHLDEAKRLLVEAQTTDKWDDLKESYQDKIYESIKKLRDMHNEL